MTEHTYEKLKQIKQSFRLLMNGTASRSMREKGTDYKVNWGVSLPDLQQLAREYKKDYDLAIALWKEDIRECKIMATLLMPADQMPPEVVDIWMEQVSSQEIVEMAAFNLFQYLAYAPILSYQWIAASDELRQMAGYLVLARLFTQGQDPDERDINEFLDQVSVALQSHHGGLRHAAMNCVIRFAELNGDYAEIARKALHLDFL